MQHLYSEYKNKGFTIVAINTDDDQKVIIDYFEKEKFDIPVAMGMKTSTAENYKVRSYPTNILLDRNGKVILRMEGFNEGQIQAEIEKLLAAP